MKGATFYNSDSRLVHFYDDKRKLIGRYDIRGGICWPTVIEEYGSVSFRGFALVCGQNVEDNIVKVLDQFNFVTTESVLSQDEDTIEHRGLTDWMNECWTKWRSERYYWRPINDTDNGYMLQVIRSKMLKIKPALLKIEWADVNAAKHMILKRIETADLQIVAGTDLADSVSQISPILDKLSPPIHALACCLMAYEKFPWQERKPRKSPAFMPSDIFIHHFPGVNQHGT